MNKSDQWKAEGDCNQCRRKNYCTKQCAARDSFCQREVLELLDDVSGGIISSNLFSKK
ncbi:hypothetical protein M2146_001148 [Lachnospiraceae bacterium PF1-22]